MLTTHKHVHTALNPPVHPTNQTQPHLQTTKLFSSRYVFFTLLQRAGFAKCFGLPPHAKAKPNTLMANQGPA